MAEKKINGREFQVGEVLATEAILLQARLMKAVGAGVERLPTILKGASKKASPEEKNLANAAAVAAFADIFARGEPAEMLALVKDVVEMASIKRPSGSVERVDMDGDFTSDKKSLFPLVTFVLQEVLGDFFTGLQENGTLKNLATG